MFMIDDPSIATLARFLDLSVRRSELVMVAAPPDCLAKP